MSTVTWTPDGVEVLAEVVDVSSTSMGQGMMNLNHQTFH